MNLLVSDYDGTLKTDTKDLMINIEYIKKFRKNGNKFMIVTGRNFDSIKWQTDHFNIPYDYLSCNDGGVLFDNRDNILNADYLDVSYIENLLGQLSNLPSTKDLELYGTHGKINKIRDIIEICIRSKVFSSKDELRTLLNKYTDITFLSFLNYTYIEKKVVKIEA